MEWSLGVEWRQILEWKLGNFAIHSERPDLEFTKNLSLILHV